MITIKRTRYVVINNRNEIFCGLARNYTFKPIDNIGDTAVNYHAPKGTWLPLNSSPD